MRFLAWNDDDTLCVLDFNNPDHFFKLVSISRSRKTSFMEELASATMPFLDLEIYRQRKRKFVDS